MLTLKFGLRLNFNRKPKFPTSILQPKPAIVCKTSSNNQLKALLARATVFTDKVAQSISIGEAQHAIAEGLISEADVAQLGAVINGTNPGRTSDDEITLFDGTGVGLQDLAVAAAVVDLAVAKGIAIEVDF